MIISRPWQLQGPGIFPTGRGESQASFITTAGRLGHVTIVFAPVGSVHWKEMHRTASSQTFYYVNFDNLQ